MKNSILLILITLITISCGSNNNASSDNGSTTVHPQPGISVDIQPYVTQFEERYNTTVSYLVDFDSASDTGSQTSNGTTVGVCKVWSDGYREVRINKTWWNGQADITRKVLIFHELGHCSFNRSHDCRTLDQSDANAKNCAMDSQNVPKFVAANTSGNRPLSMMYPTVNPIVYYYRLPQYTADYETELPGTTTSAASSMYMIDSYYQSPEFFDGDSGDCVKFMN